MTETTYDEYRAAIAAQTQRDRDRFTGIDSHPEAPMYSAETGLRLNTWSFQEPVYAAPWDDYVWTTRISDSTFTREEVGVQVQK